MPTHNVHISDVLAFKSCRRKWDFSSSLRRNLTPLGVYVPFFVGRVIHGALDRMYRYGVNPVDEVASLVEEETRHIQQDHPQIYATQIQKVNEQAVLCAAYLQHYVEWSQVFNGPFNDRDLDFINVEQQFNVPLRTDRGFIAKSLRKAGKFDGVVRYKKDDKLYLWEIKTTRSINERLKMLDLEEQADSYAIDAQQMLGEPIAGIIYMLIRKAIPETPEILKNGCLSQNKRIDTTFEHYLACIRAHHKHEATRDFISAKYGDFLQHLLDNANPFFMRICIRRTQEQLIAARNELYAVAREMTNPRIPIYHHGQPSCNWCVFREPCVAIQQGKHDEAERLLRENYTQNTYHLTGVDEL